MAEMRDPLLDKNLTLRVRRWDGIWFLNLGERYEIETMGWSGSGGSLGSALEDLAQTIRNASHVAIESLDLHPPAEEEPEPELPAIREPDEDDENDIPF